MHIPGAHHEPEADFDEALAAFGLQPEVTGEGEVPDDKCYLWPCNVLTFNVWQRVQTQWRVGMGGREGLDYSGVAVYLREVARIKPSRRWAEIWSGLQAMEAAALEAWSEKNN